MEWRKFTFDYQFARPDLFGYFVNIEAYKEAALNLVLPPDWSQKLDRLNRIRAIYGTTALEGNPLSESEVSHQIDVADDTAARSDKATKEQMQIRNASDAQKWVKERFFPESRPIDLSDVLQMHKMITQRSDTKNNVPGKLRNVNVTVGSDEMGGVHRGAPYERVPELMEQYVSFVNSKRFLAEHPVVRALLAHFFLVTIHPFGDGNGRVSRLVEAGILFQGKYNVHGFYGLSNYFYRNEERYKLALQESRQNQPFDVTPFIAFGVEGFGSELKGINNFIKTKLNRVVYRQMLQRAFNTRIGPRRKLLNNREWNLLHFLLRETEPSDPFSENPSRKILVYGELEKAGYIQLAYKNVTSRTFYRELVRLGDMGFITFTRDEVAKDWVVELDFNAISKHEGWDDRP